VHGTIDVATTVTPESQIGAAVIAQTIRRFAGATVTGEDLALINECRVGAEQGDVAARRRVVHEVIATEFAVVNDDMERAVRVSVRRNHVTGQELVACADQPPIGFAGRLVTELLVELIASEQVSEDATHQAPAVEEVVEVVRPRLRRIHLEGAIHLLGRQGRKLHAPMLAPARTEGSRPSPSPQPTPREKCTSSFVNTCVRAPGCLDLPATPACIFRQHRLPFVKPVAIVPSQVYIAA
jgi:hypothetical protein